MSKPINENTFDKIKQSTRSYLYALYSYPHELNLNTGKLSHFFKRKLLATNSNNILTCDMFNIMGCGSFIRQCSYEIETFVNLMNKSDLIELCEILGYFKDKSNEKIIKDVESAFIGYTYLQHQHEINQMIKSGADFENKKTNKFVKNLQNIQPSKINRIALAWCHLIEILKYVYENFEISEELDYITTECLTENDKKFTNHMTAILNRIEIEYDVDITVENKWIQRGINRIEQIVSNALKLEDDNKFNFAEKILHTIINIALKTTADNFVNSYSRFITEYSIPLVDFDIKYYSLIFDKLVHYADLKSTLTDPILQPLAIEYFNNRLSDFVIQKADERMQYAKREAATNPDGTENYLGIKVPILDINSTPLYIKNSCDASILIALCVDFYIEFVEKLLYTGMCTVKQLSDKEEKMEIQETLFKEKEYLQEIDALKSQNRTLRIDNENLTKTSNMQKHNKLLKQLQFENNELIKEIDFLKSEIEKHTTNSKELQNNINSYTDLNLDYIDQNIITDNENFEVISLLENPYKECKILMASYYERLNSNIKEVFPNSIDFLDGYKITNHNSNKIDLVVFDSKHLSHADFYKLKNICANYKIPYLIISTRNVNTVCKEIIQRLKFLKNY